MEEFNAIQSSASSIVLGNIDPESVHTNNVDKSKVLGSGVALRQGASKVAKGLLSGLGVGVGQIQDASKRKGGKVESLGATALEVGVVQLHIGGFKTKAKLGLPETISAVGHEPGRVGALCCVVGLASNVLGVCEAVDTGAGLCRDACIGDGNHLGVVLARHSRGIAAQAVKLASKYNVVVRGTGDGMNGAVEAVEREIFPAVLPDQGVCRVGTRKTTANIDASAFPVAVEGIHGSTKALECPYVAVCGIKQGNASRCGHVADACKVAGEDDSFSAIDGQSAHGLDVGIGNVDGSKDTIRVAGE